MIKRYQSTNVLMKINFFTFFPQKLASHLNLHFLQLSNVDHLGKESVKSAVT